VALQALEVLIAAGAVQATVADVDWARFRAAFEARRSRPLLSALDASAPSTGPTAAPAASDWVQRLRGLSRDDCVQVLESLLRAEVARTLGYSEPSDVPLDQSVFELGMDSLRAVELSIRLQQHLGLERPIQFFDAPQIAKLAFRLLEVVIVPDAPPARGVPPAAPVRPADAREPAGLVRYAPGREDEIFAFSRTAWPYRPADLIEPRWRWMFVESARRVGVEPRVWLYRDGGQIVAHHGAIPVRLQAGPDVLESAWFVDTMVLESHRTTATGARLLIDSNDEFPVGLSLGQTAQMRKIALRLGWAQVAPLQTFVLLLRPHRVLEDKLHPLAAGVASAGLNARRILKRHLAGRGGRKDEPVHVRTLDGFDASHDALWNGVRGEYACAVTRDASYLNWKYVAQPGQDFVRLEFLRGGAVVALVVLAVSEPGAIYRYRRAFVVELVVSPSDPGLVLGVLEEIRRQGVARGVDAIVFHLVSATLERMVEAYGFLRRDPTRYLLVRPLRVSPDRRRELLSPASWLVTMGDSDIDRPWEMDGGRLQVRARRGQPSLQA
jgi:acyl carrier protein